MSSREAHSKIVPRVFFEDGGGYSRPALCALCNGRIAKDTLAWGRLTTDPPSVSRPVHARCLHDYQMFALTFWIGDE